MVVKGEDHITCDFAQYYHVYDWRALPVKTAATLAAGLPENSRSIRAITGTPCDQETILLAAIADRLSMLLWAKAKKGTKKPAMLTDAILKKTKNEKIKDIQTFTDVNAFEAARQRFFVKKEE